MLREVMTELAARRKSLGLLQSEVADAAGVSQQEISKWEAGLFMPRLDNLDAYAAALGLRISVDLEEDT